MSRYIGPRLKVLRRLQADLSGFTRKKIGSRTAPPGPHGPTRRVKQSDYRTRLIEKQKLRMNYGIRERQMRRYYKDAASAQGDTGLLLVAALESRLDSVAFRMGLAPTIPAARQMVSHGHVLVNGCRVSIASYAVRVGDVISATDKAKKNTLVAVTVESPSLAIPSYLTVDATKFSATMNQLPSRDDIPLDIQENLVVEYYSKVA